MGVSTGDLINVGFTRLELYNAGIHPHVNVCYPFDPSTGHYTQLCKDCKVIKVKDVNRNNCPK